MLPLQRRGVGVKPRSQVAELANIRPDRAAEAPNVALVTVPHVKDNERGGRGRGAIVAAQHAVPLLRREVLTTQSEVHLSAKGADLLHFPHAQRCKRTVSAVVRAQFKIDRRNKRSCQFCAVRRDRRG